jgi:hypothetical protein
MDKRYQVFVSSTYEDLREERQEVVQALLNLECIPTGMELFPASDDDSWSVIKRFLSECDYYIVVVGGRYGSVGPTGKSYTEMEYDAALEAGLPVLAFLHAAPGEIPASKTENTDAGKKSLAAFRATIEAKRHCKYWKSRGELAGQVALAMPALMRSKPRTGWVRADRVTDESAAQEILRLRKQIDDLQQKAVTPTIPEDLARGDDAFTVSFHIIGSSQNPWKQIFTWNELIRILAHHLIEGADESSLKGVIEQAFINRMTDIHGTFFSAADIREEDFQTIKMQLRALGLITKVPNTSLTKWMFTPYGESVLAQVAAIRSSKASNTT